MRLGLVFACLLAAAACGCRRLGGPTPLNAGGPSGSKVWTHPGADGKPGVPGLDAGHCYYVGKLFLVWSGGANSGGGGGQTAGTDGIRGDGRVGFREGRELAYSYRIPDERTGTVVIDGAEYDLAAGRLFLVKPAGDKFVVKQIDKDLSVIELTGADFRLIGRDDPAIREFFDPPAGK